MHSHPHIIAMFTLPHTSFDNIDAFIKAIKNFICNDRKIITLKVSEEARNSLVCPLCNCKLKLAGTILKRKRIQEAETINVRVQQYSCTNKSCKCGLNTESSVSRYHLVVPDLFEPNSVFLRNFIDDSILVHDGNASEEDIKRIDDAPGYYSYLREFVKANKALVKDWKSRIGKVYSQCKKGNTKGDDTPSIIVGRFTLYILGECANALWGRIVHFNT